MATLSISLSEAELDFVQRRAADAQFSSPSEYVQALIRAELEGEQEPAEISPELEAELLRGLNSGPPTEMTREDWQDIRREVLRRHETRKRA
jgi:antitoxin ParD1/3/4